MTNKNKGLVGKMSGLGINSEAEILLYPPSKYLDLTKPVDNISDHVDGGVIYCYLDVNSNPKSSIGRGRKPDRVYFEVSDGKNTCLINIFGKLKGNLRPWTELKRGDSFHALASISEYQGNLQVSNPEFLDSSLIGKIAPRYRGKQKVITPSSVAEKIKTAAIEHMDITVNHIINWLGKDEATIIKDTRLPFSSLRDFIRAMHFPKSIAETHDVRLAMRNLSAYGIFTLSQDMKERPYTKESQYAIPRNVLNTLSASLPFELTDDQNKAINDVANDIASPYPMNRLINGDVGVGKTVVYLLPSVASQRIGKKVGILMPNTLVMNQVADEIKEYFPDVPVVRVESSKGKPRNIDLSDNPILIGTQALLFAEEELSGWVPDLLTIDEQQKLSLEQRRYLTSHHTNFMEASATPIPRTMALVTHGGMDISEIKECPVEKNIATKMVLQNGKLDMFNKVSNIIDNGGQVAIIYSLVDESSAKLKQDPDTGELVAPRIKQNVLQASQQWERLFPGRVGTLHGKMKSEEKVEIVRRMKEKEYDILISSTVVEIGITLPDLQGLVVVDADSHGLSMLHQFRGRVARKGGDGWFFLYLPQENPSEESIERMRVLEQHTDGFKVAEEDMLRRGFGDLSNDSEQQSGMSESLFPGLKVTPEDVENFLNGSDNSITEPVTKRNEPDGLDLAC